MKRKPQPLTTQISTKLHLKCVQAIRCMHGIRFIFIYYFLVVVVVVFSNTRVFYFNTLFRAFAC